jgi:hypothetical protein
LDLKKVNPGKALGYVDGLIEKIPERIMVHIRRVFYILGALILFYGLYFGAVNGYASANQEGQELGKDTRTLFQEEIERTHNRKKRAVRMPQSNAMYEDGLHTIEKMQAPSISSEQPIPSTPDTTLLQRDDEFRPKRMDEGLPPLEDISKGTTTYFQSKKDSFEAGFERKKDDSFYSETLKETPNNNYRLLEKKRFKRASESDETILKANEETQNKAPTKDSRLYTPPTSGAENLIPMEN